MESVDIPAAVEPQVGDLGVEIQKLRPVVVGELLHWKAGIFHPKMKTTNFRKFDDIEKKLSDKTPFLDDVFASANCSQTKDQVQMNANFPLFVWQGRSSSRHLEAI